jgi:hypothetical protein
MGLLLRGRRRLRREREAERLALRVVRLRDALRETAYPSDEARALGHPDRAARVESEALWFAAIGKPIGELIAQVGAPSWDSRTVGGDAESGYRLRAFESGPTCTP